jgi:hypothetical protein
VTPKSCILCSMCNHYHEFNANPKRIPANSTSKQYNICVRVFMCRPTPTAALCSSPDNTRMHPPQMIVHLILPRKRLSSHSTPLTPFHRTPEPGCPSRSRVYCLVVSPEFPGAAKRLVEASRRKTLEVILTLFAVAEERADGDVGRGSGLVFVMHWWCGVV